MTNFLAPIHVRRTRVSACIFLFALIGSASRALGQLEFEKPPISYHETDADNPISRLQEKIDDGSVKLIRNDRHGYLPSVLEALDIPTSSQLLVFSKTSQQIRRISPRRPRAIYFNDESYVAYVQHSDRLELSTTDPKLGGVFYTLKQTIAKSPQFVRDTGQCLICHASSRTQRVPGHVVRSVFADRTGQPAFGSGTFNIDHSSSFSKRFGGWYVTGTHGPMRHMGNSQVASIQSGEELDREAGANVEELDDRFDTSKYLEPTSDIVAHLVLQHQTQMHNYITHANMEGRSALHYNEVIRQALELPAGQLSESTQRRIDSASKKLVRYLLFSGEFRLQSLVAGTNDFRKDFESRGPRDAKGRSLYQLDLNTRLLRYPCSWLIHGEAFDALPKPVYERVASHLGAVLSGKDDYDDFKHLTKQDRVAIREILQETKPELAKHWK